MEIYVENLYERVIQKNGDKYSSLRIISGYSSAKFLEKVLSEFPNLKVQLFIGMALEGISIQNHEMYKKIQTNNSRVEVLYQIESPKNHMKIFEFSNVDDIKTYIGSANFSENGFYFQKEILTECDFNGEQLFNEQIAISKSCLDEHIEQYISFYDDKQWIEDDETAADMDVPKQPIHIRNIAKENQRKYITKMKSINSRINPTYYHKFDLSIVLPSDSNWKWDKSGINAWNDGGIVELIETPKSPFNVLFPTDITFKVFADDGEIYHAKLAGTENKRRLRFLNLNLYEFVAKHIDLKELRPISYEDLVKAQSTTLYFTRLNEVEYIMSFSKQSY